MPRKALIPPMNITAEELADRLLALPPNPKKKRKRAAQAGSNGNHNHIPMVAKSR